MKSRPYALTEWFDSSASQIQGTSAPGRGRSVAVRLQGAGQEGLDLVRSRDVAFEKIGPLLDEGRRGVAWPVAGPGVGCRGRRGV